MSHLDLNQPEETLQTTSLGEKLNLVIENLPPNGVTLIEILEIIGNDSLMLVTIFLSLVFLVPVSIPGVSTVFGSAILLIGITQLFRRKLWLPKRIASRSLSTERLISGLNRALVWFHRLEKISRPHRLGWFVNGRAADLVNKLSFILAALLLMVPFGFIPFSNTLPAIALIFLAVGIIQKDGGSILLGHLSNVATIIYFSALVAGGGLTVYELFRLMMAG
ncbi:MAG: exopolysaccharide biosynthesis protein [Anaerolineae bacterium]|nr:exopolysaccharide biosynthesis protein [Anaerolineae bacterium]